MKTDKSNESDYVIGYKNGYATGKEVGAKSERKNLIEFLYILKEWRGPFTPIDRQWYNIIEMKIKKLQKGGEVPTDVQEKVSSKPDISVAHERGTPKPKKKEMK